ncbi:uncharacterized protein LOC121868802 [Homarus americanus]|uniref:Uncharacterized protein n=1 Tax=Homarus americanus TaxID=6706 RepID=A0A8J5K4V6_HOMAM|nr:uncharacterized protein LOC121868802 [Homarus americanus]KAG7167065.1 hypothetical protein Hamer_G005394 [Homarus americanus]
MSQRGVVIVAVVALVAVLGVTEAFIKNKKKGPPPPPYIPIPCYVETEYITSYVKEYRPVPVYITKVIPEVNAEVVLKTAYTTRAFPIVVTQPRDMYVTRTSHLDLITTQIKQVPQASVDYEPIAVSHTAHIPVTITDTKILTKTVRSTSYVTRHTTSYTTNVVTTTRVKKELSIFTKVITTTSLLTNTVLATKSLCVDHYFKQNLNDLLVAGVGGLIGSYESTSHGSRGIYTKINKQLHGSYGNKHY